MPSRGLSELTGPPGSCPAARHHILTGSRISAPTVSYKPFPAVSNFLPIVLANGKIHLEVRPEISARNDANGITIPSTVRPGHLRHLVSISATPRVTVEMEDGKPSPLAA